MSAFPLISDGFKAPRGRSERRFEETTAHSGVTLLFGENGHRWCALSAIRSLSRTCHAIYHEGHLAREDALTIIPKILHEHINNSYPAHVCLIGTVLPNGYAQITPRGSTMVFDDEHLALWERGRGSTNANLADGSKVTVFFRKPPLREIRPVAARRHRALLWHRENLQVRSDL